MADSNPKIETANKFLYYIKNNNANEAFKMLNPDVYDSTWLHIVKFNVNRTHTLVEKYGTAPKNEWIIEYDTARPILKLYKIKIPIYKGYDVSNELEEAYILLDFDNTGHFLPDTIIGGFKLYTKYKGKIGNIR